MFSPRIAVSGPRASWYFLLTSAKRSSLPDIFFSPSESEAHIWAGSDG